MISLPTNFIADLMNTIGQVFTDLSPLVLLVVGVIIGVYIVSNLFWSWIDRQNGIK